MGGSGCHSLSLPGYVLESVLWARIRERVSLASHESKSSERHSVSSTDDGHNLFHIVEAVYDEHIIFHLTNFNDGKPFQVMELYGRVFSR